MNYLIDYYCISHIGKVRKKHQDNFWCGGRCLKKDLKTISSQICGTIAPGKSAVMGVFDGLGGLKCGENASYIAACKAGEIVADRKAISKLEKYCREANDEICRFAKEHNIVAAGTTVAMLCFSKKEIVLCNVGDSKIFRISKGEIRQISKDHVINLPNGKRLLSQNLGMDKNEYSIEPYFACGDYYVGDAYLICSDGITDMLTQKEIKGIINSEKHENAAKHLVYEALKKGGKDNICVILCKIKKSFKPLDKGVKYEKYVVEKMA